MKYDFISGMSVLWKIATKPYNYVLFGDILTRFLAGGYETSVYRRVISTSGILRRSDDLKEPFWNQTKCQPSAVRSTAFRGILKDKLTITFARSSGPGGQNVNKVNTKVDVRFHVQTAEWLPQEVRDKLLQMEKNRINNLGELVVTSTKSRSQTRNLEDAIEKIVEMVEKAAYVPRETTPEKKAHVRKLIRKANERRLVDKKLRSSKKRERKMDI